MRRVAAVVLFAASCGFLATADLAGQQPDPKQPKKEKGKFDPPEAKKPDEATLKVIAEKTELLRKAVAALKAKKIADDVLVEVEIYLKAAENIVRFEEWYAAASGKWALTTLDQGLARAKQAEGGKAVWRDAPGKWVLLAYRSRIDDSIQPYAVLYPHDFGKDPKKRWRLDIVLHGRDSSLTEAKFIATHNGTAPKDLGYIQLEVYGRGNNAYRWSGEADVFEALATFNNRVVPWVQLGEKPGLSAAAIDLNRVVLRGFSMGGAGTWHIGLHHPSDFCVMGPGAGFTTTHGYVGGLPKVLPDYQEKCLRIYDAVDYAENVFNIPVVAYSGGIDPQKAAADNIENALKSFKESHHFTHLVAPNLPHTMPKEWQEKAEAEYRKYADNGRATPDRIRFVTYTLRYSACYGVKILALDEHYRRSLIDLRRSKDGFLVTTENVRAFLVTGEEEARFLIDGQTVVTKKIGALIKDAGRWREIGEGDAEKRAVAGKMAGQQGPIDDAFIGQFVVVGAKAAGWPAAAQKQFAGVWDRYFRGTLPTITEAEYDPERRGNLVLFGDPQSNPLIAKALPKLPIIWTKEKLVVNGVEYDPKTHTPVLIYPNPLTENRSYVVINSGHTFKEADLKGTNALLYPRLGDWAVIKPRPTEKDPAAYEVVAAGLFDENWQFAGPVADGAKLEKLWGEGEFTEGPAEGPDGAIYFSDIGNRIMRFDPKTGKTTEYRKPSGRANGLKFDGQGRLVACEGANTGGGRRVSATEKDGTVKTLADSFEGKRFNAPNDLTIDAKGRIYFSDPRYLGNEKRELEQESVYRIDPDGTVTRVISDVTKPNGLVISPDGKTLYVAESNSDKKKPRELRAYPLNADGTVGAGKKLYDFGDGRGIDGMTVTADGAIVATAGRNEQAGVYFFSPEGKKLAFLPTPEDPTNCCFAGSDRKTLYVTAGKSLYRVKLSVAGK